MRTPMAPLTMAERDAVEENLPLLDAVANGTHCPLSQAERVQEGTFGLVRAVRKWRAKVTTNADHPRGGASFRNYARLLIRGAILDACREMEGRNDATTHDEPNRRRVGSDTVSITRAFEDGHEYERFGNEPDFSGDSDERLSRPQIARELYRQIGRLKPLQQTIVRETMEGKTLHEIGDGLGFTESYICQQLSLSKKLLRTYLLWAREESALTCY